MYYDNNLKKIQSKQQLNDRGLNTLTDNDLVNLSIYPYIEQSIEYDKYFYDLVKDGDPELVNNKMVQKLKAVDANEFDVKQRLKEFVSNKRWQIETGGIVLNGSLVLTGTADQNRISSVLALCSVDSTLTTLDFKGADGWMKITTDMLKGIASAIGKHVQWCFTKEMEYHTLIDTSTIEELKELDIINDDW